MKQEASAVSCFFFHGDKLAKKEQIHQQQVKSA
jgi:hypothetical protein